jgi:resuscitation-promoting factor RpfB
VKAGGRWLLVAGVLAVAVLASTGHQATAGSVSGGPNVSLGRKLAEGHGWTGHQFDCLNWLWTRESGWDAVAVNPESGATGIPQLLPSAHAIPAGWDSAQVQIQWGLEYIAGRYGDPCTAWDHEQQYGWY